MRKLKPLLVSAVVLCGTSASTFASNATAVSVAVAAESSISIVTGTTNLTESSAAFSPYAGTTDFTYAFRTATGGGAIKLQVTTDFSPTGGPLVASPTTTVDRLSYTSAVDFPAPAVNGTASTLTQTNIATLPMNSNSSTTTNCGSISGTLVDDPKVKTGPIQPPQPSLAVKLKKGVQHEETIVIRYRDSSVRGSMRVCADRHN